jgi:ER lumen protein retaining receptor
VRYSSDGYFEPVSVIFGIIQTLLYADFAWIYYTRQRVKLRAGGVVDSDDLSRGWFLRKVLGPHGQAFDEEVAPRGRPGSEDDDDSRPSANARAPNGSGRAAWGARGISVSADEGVLEAEARKKKTAQAAKKKKASDDPKARDEEFAGMLQDDSSDEDDVDGVLGPAEQETGAARTAWDDEADHK